MNRNTSQQESKIQVIKPSLPEGGGTTKGMGEQFAPHEFSGAASLSIPIPASPCRGMAPSLQLSYSSGNSNSAFGYGWDLSMSHIIRQTSKGIPKYDDTDTFLLAGDDYLLKDTRTPSKEISILNITYCVQRYIPRVEQGFSLIEHFVNTTQPSDQFWKVTSAGNSVMIYGKSPEARIVHPDDSSKIFKWLPEEAYDDHGNHQVMRYQQESDEGLSEIQLASGRNYTTNCYPAKIQYGNPVAITDGSLAFGTSATQLTDIQWQFEVVFDFGQYDLDQTSLTSYSVKADAKRDVRTDPFSTYDAGFEIRTWRLCKNVLLFHRFPELNKGVPMMVNRLTLTYRSTAFFSFLLEAQHSGNRLNTAGTAYESKALPPLTLDYTSFLPLEEGATAHAFQQMDGHTWDNQFVDLYGAGIPGLLLTDGESTLFRSPETLALNGDSIAYKNDIAIDFPTGRMANGPQHALNDVTGNGALDLVVTDPAQSGYFEMLDSGEWANFQPFTSFPLTYQNPQQGMADLTGNGLADVVLLQQEKLTYFPSKREEGYAPGKNVPTSTQLPNDSAPSKTVLKTFGDFLGAGAAQRVEIRNKSVMCWPGLGYGKFGAGIALENAPDLGPDFDTSRLHLADIDGSGTADLLYVYPDHVACYLNQSGNGFAPAFTIPFPAGYSWNPLDTVQTADVLGNGTSCLVFTKMAPTPSRWFYNFNLPQDKKTPAQRPHLLQTITNNLGATTQITYRSSAWYFLEDQKNGNPWVSHLPFPVNVIAQVTHSDEISGSSTTGSYTYSHGYYDGVEREFRGFGFVGRTDSHSFDAFNAPTESAEQAAYEQAPAITKTWYHTGANNQEAALITAYHKEFWKGDTEAYGMPASIFSYRNESPDKQTIHGAHRALHGTVLRTEVYGNDGTPWANLPYAVSEAQFEVIQLQEKGKEKYAVFRLQSRQSMSMGYSRNAKDPMVSHSLTLKTDVYGHVLEAAEIIYPRRKQASANLQQQNQMQITVATTDLANPGEIDDTYLLGIPLASKQYEIKGQTPDQGLYFEWEELSTKITTAFQTPAQTGLLSWERGYYFDPVTRREVIFDAKNPIIPVLHHRSEHVVYDKSALSVISGIPDDLTTLLTGDGTTTQGAHGGYITFDSNGSESNYFWNPGASQTYGGIDTFFLPEAFFDPFQYASIWHGSTVKSLTDVPKTTYAYDPHLLLTASVTDALGNTSVMSDFDYAQLHAKTMTDANANFSKVVTDPLGMVIATAHGGTQGNDTVGFDVEAYVPAVSPHLGDILTHPTAYLQEAATYFFYDLDAWLRDQIPIYSVHLNYTEYTSINGAAPDHQRIHKAVAYSDGFGRALQAKAWVDTPQEVRYLDGAVVKTKMAEDSWLTTGAVVYNNKGNAIRQFEPFYAASYTFQDSNDLNKVGVASTLFYDAMDQSVLIQGANGFFSKTLVGELRTDLPEATFMGYLNQQLYTHLGTEHFDSEGNPTSGPEAKPYVFQPSAWSSLSYDENDCSTMLQLNDVKGTDVDKDAFTKAQAFANTPHLGIMDPDGQVIETRQCNVSTVEQNINYTTYNIYGNALTQTDQRLAQALDHVHNFETTYVLGTAVQMISADAGTSLSFADVAGSSLYQQDGRGFKQYATYDVLLRPTEVIVVGGSEQNATTGVITPLHLNNTVKKMVYCDTTGGIAFSNAQNANLIGKAVFAFDESGLHLAPAHSILGTALCSRQWIKSDYKQEANWSGIAEADLTELAGSLKNIYTREELAGLTLPEGINTLMLGDNFTTASTHDAIGEVLTATDADGNEQTSTSDSLGRDIAISTSAGANAKATGETSAPGTISIAYNAKGQQTKEVSSNGVVTNHSYDPYNFRLTIIKSTRSSDSKVLQDLNYHHDPVGNVCSVTDNSKQTTFFNNQLVEPKADYTFNSLYQLIRATGREQAGLWSNTQQNEGKDGQAFYEAHAGQKNNGNALQNYTQTYSYDAGGNLLMQKQTNGITRTNKILEDNNRLEKTGTGDTLNSCAYDAHGNMLTLSGTAGVVWNYRDNMASATQIERPDSTNNNDTEYYVYDGGGQRVRKISEQLGANGSTNLVEVLYAGGIEIRRSGTTTNTPFPGGVRGGYSSTTDTNWHKVWHNVKLMQGRAVSCLWRYQVMGSETGASASQQRFQLTDLLDSSNYEVDQTGQLITYEEFYPYGGTSIITATNATEVKNKHYRYSSKEQDRTGLYYYGMRYYAPWLGRWTCTDPAGTVDGLNIYAFVEGNPVTSVDVGGMNIDLTKHSKDDILRVKPSKKQESDIGKNVDNNPKATSDNFSNLQKEYAKGLKQRIEWLKFSIGHFDYSRKDPKLVQDHQLLNEFNEELDWIKAPSFTKFDAVLGDPSALDTYKKKDQGAFKSFMGLVRKTRTATRYTFEHGGQGPHTLAHVLGVRTREKRLLKILKSRSLKTSDIAKEYNHFIIDDIESHGLISDLKLKVGDRYVDHYKDVLNKYKATGNHSEKIAYGQELADLHPYATSLKKASPRDLAGKAEASQIQKLYANPNDTDALKGLVDFGAGYGKHPALPINNYDQRIKDFANGFFNKNYSTNTFRL